MSVLKVSAVFRVGIGRPKSDGGSMVKNYVLSKPSLFGSLKLKKAYKRFQKSVEVLAKSEKDEAKSYFSGKRV